MKALRKHLSWLRCGLIIYAYAIQEAMLQPSGPMSMQGRLALASGTILYTLNIVLSYWRATGKVMWWRIVFALGMAGVVISCKTTDVFYTLLICFTGLLMLCVLEEKNEIVFTSPQPKPSLHDRPRLESRGNSNSGVGASLFAHVFTSPQPQPFFLVNCKR